MPTRRGAVRELTVELLDADELFADRRPDVASGTPALPPGIERIRDQLEPNPPRTPVTVVIALPRAGVAPGLDLQIRRAVGRYCEIGTARADNELRLLRREGIRALLVGSVLFGVFVSISTVIVRSSLPGPIRTFFGADGLFVVVAWVGLWFPIDTLLYSGRPYRREKNVLRALRGMQIVIRDAG